MNENHKPNRNIIRFFCAALLLLTACSRNVEGEVFVVTKAGESKKLALVNVFAYKVNDLDAFRQALINDLTEFMKARALTMPPYPNPVLSLDIESERILYSQRLIQSVQAMTKDLPKIKSQSDSDGRFQMELPSDNYLIVAVGARMALGEEYIWLMKTPTNGKLRLANDSMFDKGCEYCFLSKDDLATTLVEAERQLEFTREKRRDKVLLEISPDELISYQTMDCNDLKRMAAQYPNSAYSEKIDAFIFKRWRASTCP